MAENRDEPGTGDQASGGAPAGGGATAYAAAVALGRTTHSAEVKAKAAGFLESQRRLADAQLDSMSEERRFQLSHLRWRRFGDWMKAALQVVIGVAGLAVVVGVGAMVWQAHEDHGLVIEAFSVPPDLARDGLTGQVVAARFLDRLQAMETATESERPADSYQHDWGSQIKVEIPQTGLTIGELERLLRERVGHLSHLTGEVFRIPTGIALTARLGEAPPQTFTGSQSDFDSLAQKAAEAVYRTSQPYRYTWFLYEHGRGPEAVGVISDLAANGPQSERGWTYASWGFLDLSLKGDVRAAEKHLRQSLAYPTGKFLAAAGLENLEVWVGHDEKALQYCRMVIVELNANRNRFTKEVFANQAFAFAADLAQREGDYLESARQNSQVARTPDFLGSDRLYPPLAATAYALDHDPAAATSAIEPLDPNDDVSFLQGDAVSGLTALPVYAIAAARDDWPTALADVRTSDAWLEARKSTQNLMVLVQRVWVHPLEALALAKTGDVPGAEALIATTPADCYVCVRVRAKIAAAKQDWPTAERWFAQAVRQAPSLPVAWSEWGEMRLTKGDPAGAIAKFQLAHQKGPHFADPLEMWGEALMRRGDFRGAAEKFAEADKYAPRWGRNHMMWGQALARSGKAGEARTQWRAAARLDLSVEDRAALAALHA